MYTFNFKIQYKRQTLTVNIKKNFMPKSYSRTTYSLIHHWQNKKLTNRGKDTS